MKVYIWEVVERLTGSKYHPDGGLVVVAKSETAARALFESAKETKRARIPPDQRPDAVYPTSSDASPRVFIFPNAGCC